MDNDVNTQRTLGSIEAKVDIILEQLPPLIARITALEKRQWLVMGGAMTIGMLLTFAWHFLSLPK